MNDNKLRKVMIKDDAFIELQKGWHQQKIVLEEIKRRQAVLKADAEKQDAKFIEQMALACNGQITKEELMSGHFAFEFQHEDLGFFVVSEHECKFNAIKAAVANALHETFGTMPAAPGEVKKPTTH